MEMSILELLDWAEEIEGFHQDRLSEQTAAVLQASPQTHARQGQTPMSVFDTHARFP